MSEDHKAPDVTIGIPAPRVFGEQAAREPDARIAEVLRALHRAKGTIAGPEAPTSPRSMEALAWELRSLREWLSKTSPVVEEAARRLASSATVFERAVLVPSEKLKRQADALAAWRAWWARHVAAFCLVIAILLAGGIGLAWRAHTLAKTTRDVLAQILENQERAQAAKVGKRR